MNRNRNTFSAVNKQITLSNLVLLGCLALIAGGIVTSIYMNWVDRSLWLDEAMLAWSFSKRPFFQLGNGPFEWLQSAPLGWLYFEKCLAVLFGNTEFVLRIGSILGFILTIVVLYILLKQMAVPPAFRLSACAFYANMPFILQYANVFKPYIFDGFVVLLAILLFSLHEQGRIRAWVLTLCWAVLVWFSTPVCFFEGGLLLAAGVSSLIKKDLRRLKYLVLLGIVILISFAVHYFFWLGDESLVNGMQDCWAGQNFPLIPRSLADLKKLRDMTSELFRHFGDYTKTIFLLSVLTLFLAIKRKQTVVIGCYVGVFLSLFASWINMFPIEDRMWCFLYPLTIFLSFYGISCLSAEDSKWGRLLLCFVVATLFYPQFHLRGLLFAFLLAYGISEILPSKLALNLQTVLALVLSLFLALTLGGIGKYLNHADAVFWNGEEVNSEIVYLEKNLKSDEHVYVYYSSVPGFQFKHGYSNNSIAGFQDNITYGKGHFQATDDCEDEIDKVINRDKVYIVSSHLPAHRFEKLIKAMHEEGFFQLVSYEHQTPLWFFCRNIEDSKIHVSYETEAVRSVGKQRIVTVLLHNDGPAYINHQFETVCLVNTETGERSTLPDNIAPGSSVELTLSYEGESPPVFRLENEYGPVCADSDYVPGE